MKRFAFIVLLLFVLSGCTSGAYKEAMEKGNNALERENYSEALNAYENALEEKPDDKDADSKIKEVEKKYESELNSIILGITEKSAQAEEMVNAYSSVWDAVFTITLEKNSFAASLGVDVSEVEKYVEFDYHGYVAFKGNFEDAIENAHKVYEGTGKIQEIKDGQNEISQKIKSLNNPPKKYKEAYDSVVDLYKAYEEYISFALSPSGSYITYNQEANQLTGELVSQIKESQVRLPN